MATTLFTFPPDTLGFLRDVRQHNERTWFESNRSRYEAGSARDLPRDWLP
jgi:uncharacterized protein (DUF2461 family)